MKIEIKIPTLGESVSEATVSAILKPTGSFVKLDEEILELETDKVNQVLYAPQSGELKLNVKVDEVVKIGQVIGFIESDSKQGSVQETKKPPEVPLAVKSSENKNSRVTMSDFAKELDSGVKEVPIQEPQPKSPHPKEAPSRFTRKKMSNLRKVIAERLVLAKNTTAMLTTFNEVDMTAVMQIRAKEKETFFKKHGVKLGFMSFFVKGVVAALKQISEVNASIDGDEIITYQTYDIGVAVSTERGLMVPVVRNCDQLNFGSLEKEIEMFSEKARSGTISIDDLRGGSFTITNGGVFGSLLSTPILNPPQSAILGMHSIIKRAVVVNDQIVICPMMYIALSYDHRIVDGKEAVLFLVHLKNSLEDPSRLLLDL